MLGHRHIIHKMNNSDIPYQHNSKVKENNRKQYPQRNSVSYFDIGPRFNLMFKTVKL